MNLQNRDMSLKEEFDPGLKKALFANFSNYREAFLELTDNAVSNRIEGKKLRIDILVSNKDLQITNFGGYGMDIKELKEFLKWGRIKERRITDIGAYGQGGKSALGYLGRSMQIIASPLNKKIEYRFEDDNLEDYKLKKYTAKPLNIDILAGYVRIEVGKLKRKIKDEEIKKVLIDTYRPLIEFNQIEIYYNREKLKVKAFPVEADKEKFSFDVQNYYQNFKNVRGWIGRLISRSGLKGGLRCYKLGRLISGQEFFEHPDPSQKQTLNFLFGEIFLDHVPVTTNKTDFDRDSIQWQEVQEKMFKILKPHIDELLGREIKEPSDEDKQRVKDAREIMAEILKRRDKKLKDGGALVGEVFGQKPHESRVGEENRLESTSIKRGEYKPRTPPPPGAIGKRHRLKEFIAWNVRPMDENMRSIIEEKKDGGKLLVINNLFPGYKVQKGHLIYLIETAAMQLSLPEDEEEKISPQGYLKSFDELYAFCCENFESVREDYLKKKGKN